MPVWGVSIEKEVDWRGGAERFSNVYHYNVFGLNFVVDPEAFITQLVAAERQVFAGDVRFKVGRVWTAGGTARENEMKLVKDLTGVGSAPSLTNIHRELAYLISWPLARKSNTGRKVYLRKYLHSCSIFSTSSTSSLLSGSFPITDTQRTPLMTYANAIHDLGFANNIELCSPSGERRSGPPVVNSFLRHRQFRR